ncbi:hypothetical protein [Actinoalloteichus spitiensis]|uniref:hypothetical protein n=1 Tax=Actinoalloteichus spitiensis TaxID=252394 RepID=UPI0012F6B1AD|nr:hypothetical protein [Actinoalloteichus spitiensis]
MTAREPVEKARSSNTDRAGGARARRAGADEAPWNTAAGDVETPCSPRHQPAVLLAAAELRSMIDRVLEPVPPVATEPAASGRAECPGPPVLRALSDPLGERMAGLTDDRDASALLLRRCREVQLCESVGATELALVGLRWLLAALLQVVLAERGALPDLGATPPQVPVADHDLAMLVSACRHQGWLDLDAATILGCLGDRSHPVPGALSTGNLPGRAELGEGWVMVGKVVDQLEDALPPGPRAEPGGSGEPPRGSGPCREGRPA